jgi:hypothetical protein
MNAHRPCSSLRLVLAAAALATATANATANVPALDFNVEVLSGRPDTVSGGDALVRIDVPRNVPMQHVRVELNGTDVTSSLVRDDAARRYTGIVASMTLGDNRLAVYSNGRGNGRPSAELTLTNYPIQGPVFSGPHQQPYVCQTQSFNLPAGLGNLGPTSDPNCHVPTRVDHVYRTTTGSLAAWPAGATSYPANMAMATTTQGKTVPYVIRLETGTVNRAIYQTAVLHDPLTQPAPSFQAPPAHWNGRLIYTFGGGCINGWYRQGTTTGGVTDDFMLRSGYALASSTLNVFGNNCSDLTAAETMMMVKERFIERFGPPAHTQGWGCSGGSYAQHQIADNYPGLLDGIIPGCSFPEVMFATAIFITDAWLLDNYFNTRANVPWSDEQKRQATGFGNYNTAPNVAVGARRIDPDVFCGVLTPAQRYDAVNNPTGARCDIYDHAVNVLGRDPATGFARRPLDNVGVQYGLRLLNAGVIGVEQFLDLNERIGGFDIDANILPPLPGQRTVADLQAVRAAYRSGRLANGGGGLASLPIIDYRAYADEIPQGDIHVRYHSFSLRERLLKANGRADNQVMLHEDLRYGLYSNASPLLQYAILAMDRWITAIKADTRSIPQIEKVVQNRPSDLVEGCMTRDPNPVFVPQALERNPATSCESLYPSNSFPREVAGAGVAADVIKCQLRAPQRADYPVAFSDPQWARLQAAFPQGVCDWTRPGVEQQGLAGTWQRF